MATLPPDERRKATRLLHDDPPRARHQRRSSPCPTASSIRASWRMAARLLREAAALTTQPTLKKFLETRADAFLTNDYYASDVAWMELDASIEPTIGPYEVYEDEWFNFKAASKRSSRCVTMPRPPSWRRSAPSCRRSKTTCPSIPTLAESEARRARADPRRQRGVHRRRRQSRRADRRLQPAERRARGQGEGQQARDAEERAGGEVLSCPAADRQGGARCPPISGASPSTRSSLTS